MKNVDSIDNYADNPGEFNNNEKNDNQSNYQSLENEYKNKKLNLENSPDGEKFDKCVDELNRYIRENSVNENNLMKVFTFFNDISKKSKYQIRILDTPVLVSKMKEILLKSSNYPEVGVEISKIILNISKNINNRQKMIFETSFSFNCLFEILLVNLNTTLTYYLLLSFSNLTSSKEILDGLVNIQKSTEVTQSMAGKKEGRLDPQISMLISQLNLNTITMTFAEKILDDLISSNKKVLLEILENLYKYENSFITKEAIEPLVRCLGNKSNDVVINGLKVLLFFTKNKSFHNDLLNANFIFRLVRTYKQGIDEMDVVIVKILFDLFDNKNLYEVLFENNVLLILSNYLVNFEVEKNEKYEEVIRNVFEIFKLINKNTEEENNKNQHTLQNPLLDDKELQKLIFKKAYSLAAISKNESSILSCLSLLQIMLSKFSSILLYTNESAKSIIELVPPFFKNKNTEVIKYSLSIFEIILSKKSTYFQETYVQSSTQSFSIKSLVHSLINLVNEFSGNYELLSMSCRILVALSDIPRLQPHFLEEPQITVLKVFNDNLLRKQRQLKREKKNIEEKLAKNEDIDETSTEGRRKRTELNNTKRGIKTNTAMSIIKENESVKIDEDNSPQVNNIQAISPSPLKLNKKIKLASTPSEAQKAVNLGRKYSSGGNASGGVNRATGSGSGSTCKYEERGKYYLSQIEKIEKRIGENVNLLKDSFEVISNLSKNVDNLEVLTLKGFLDVVTEKLNDNDTETLPYVSRCIEGFCQGQSSIEIILKVQIINKILTIYKIYRIEDQRNKETKIESSLELNEINERNNAKKDSFLKTTGKRFEVLKSLKNILESDIKLQRNFIIEKGIEILLNDVSNDSTKINEIICDQLNEMILRVIYVVSCNINKLFLIYFNSQQDSKITENSEFNSSFENSEEENKDNDKEEKKEEIKGGEDKLLLNDVENILIEKENKNGNNLDNESKKEEPKNSDESFNSNKEENSNSKPIKVKSNTLEYDEIDNAKQRREKLLTIFKDQLSERKFMDKLTEVGEFDINSLNTYKELIKIFINLYLNRYYLKYFTLPKNFDKVISIINNIMKKFKESKSNDGNYETMKLIIIFLKFICEDENLIKKFLKENVISISIDAIVENNFYENKDEIEHFYYNFSLVLLRLTEFNGYISRFEEFPDFFKTLQKLYDVNSLNGKIYIISVIRNIIAEKQDFFDEIELSEFLNKIVIQKNSLVIYEFVELIKNLVHSRSMCKRLEKVFMYLVTEIKSPIYSSEFKKKMLDLILCLSYENSSIKDYSLQDLLGLVKDINIEPITTLLIYMNFSSLPSNFSFLMQDYKEQSNRKKDGNKINLTKKDFVQVVNQLIESGRFCQILIQRLLINITSIDGIDMSIISVKIMRVLLEILTESQSLQDNIIIFSLATLVNITNRNVLRFEELNQENEENKNQLKFNNNNAEKEEKGYIGEIENNDEVDDTPEEETKDNKMIPGKSLFAKLKNKKSKIAIPNKIKAKFNKIGNSQVLIKEEQEQPKNNGGGINNNNNDEKIKNIINSNEKNKNKEEQEDYKPLPESDKEVVIIDYIFEKLPNIIEIIERLFKRESLDICSLTIMLCCNLLRKIKLSKYVSLESQIYKCIEDYINNEQLLNMSDNGKALLKDDSGKFLLIALIKYFVCLSVEDNYSILLKNNSSSIIPAIIMNSLKEYPSYKGKLKQFRIEISDIKENTINFALVENQLTLFNLILLLVKKKNIKYYFTYQSSNELRQNIEFFFEEFSRSFAWLLSKLKSEEEEENKKKKFIKRGRTIKDEKRNSLKNLININNKNIEESDKNTNNKNEKDPKTLENEPSKEGVILKNQTIQNILISCLKIMIEYLIDTELDKDEAKKNNKSFSMKRDINVSFYNKISNSFDGILICILDEPSQYLSEELKSLIVYTLFLLFSNALETKEKLNETKISIKNSKNANKLNDTTQKLKSKLDENVNLQKWLIKLFTNSNQSLQNDFFCLKIFTISIHSERFPESVYQKSKFIRKLLLYIKYYGTDKKKLILKTECERLLNIISFDPKSHSVLYRIGVYSLFKSNLFSKVVNSKKLNINSKRYDKNRIPPVDENNICQKEDYILLVNMILNKDNLEFTKDDLKRILHYIFPSKDLTNNLRVALFEIYINFALDYPNEKYFHEDYLGIFRLFYDNLRKSFSELIFIFDKFTKTYQHSIRKFFTEDKIIISIFYDFLKFDDNFPSKPEEFSCYLKILEIYIESGDVSEDFEKMLQKLMTRITDEKKRENLRDINILHSILNFSFLFFVKFCEKINLAKKNENINEIELNEEPEKEKLPEHNGDESEEYDSSSADGKKKKIHSKEELDAKKLKAKVKLKNFVNIYKYSQLIDSIIYNTFSNNETKGIYILSMYIIQDDYKFMLQPLKDLHCQLFQKSFILGIFNKFVDIKKLDIKEFVFIMHLIIVLSNIGIEGGECMEELILEIIEIYRRYLLKNLNCPKSLDNNINKGNNQKNNSSEINNDTSKNIRSNLNNEVNNNDGKKQNPENAGTSENNNNNNSMITNNNSESNLFDDTITSIYFFCDLIKINEISLSGLGKVLDFLIYILSNISGLSLEQKEILVRYYQEILLHYKIENKEQLLVQLGFLKKIHKDPSLNFIESLIFGTIIVNSKRELIIKNIKDFLVMVNVVCLNNDASLIKVELKNVISFYKFCKQICRILTNNIAQNENRSSKNVIEDNKQDNEDKTAIKIALETTDSYVKKIYQKGTDMIKSYPDLGKKFEKLKNIIQKGISS